MKSTILLISFALISTLIRAGGTAPPQSPVDFYDVPEMPLAITSAELRKAGDADAVEFSATNRSGERLAGLRLILLVVSPAGKVRGRTSWVERIGLGIGSTSEHSSKVPARIRMKAGDRVVLAVEQVIGEESIWKVINAKDAFTAYAMHAPPVPPDVRRVSNNVDVGPGERVP